MKEKEKGREKEAGLGGSFSWLEKSFLCVGRQAGRQAASHNCLVMTETSYDKVSL